jgi:hypothetical protein
MTGHSLNTIIRANNELESNEIISSVKTHRQTTIYTIKEKIKLSKNESSFLLVTETITKEQPLVTETITKDQSLVTETITNRLQKLKPLVTETITRSNDLSYDLNILSSSSSISTDPNNGTQKKVIEKDDDVLSQRENKAQDILYPIFPKLWDMRPFLKEDLQEIGKYPDDQIKEVGLTAKRDNVHVKRLAVYIMKGLKHHAVLYADKIVDNTVTETPVKPEDPTERDWTIAINIPYNVDIDYFRETRTMRKLGMYQKKSLIEDVFILLKKHQDCGMEEKFKQQYPGVLETLQEMINYVNSQPEENIEDGYKRKDTLISESI